MTHRTRIAVWTALAAFHVGLGLPNAASATPTLVFSHVGDTDPEDVSEGWTRTGLASPGVIDAGAADVEIGPVSPDPNCRGCGLDAWGVDDRSPDEGTVLRYEQQVTREQARDASNLGWTLRVHLRVASESDFPNSLDDFWLDSAIFAAYIEKKSGTHRFRLTFGANFWGEPVVGFPIENGVFLYQSAGATED